MPMALSGSDVDEGHRHLPVAFQDGRDGPQPCGIGELQGVGHTNAATFAGPRATCDTA